MYGKQKGYRYIVMVCFGAVLLFGCTRQGKQPQATLPGATEGTQAALTQPVVPTEEAAENPTVTEAVPTVTPMLTSAVTPTPTRTATPTPPPVITDPYDGRFWMGQYADDKTVLMTASEIAAQNVQSYQNDGTNLTDLTKIDGYTKEELRTLIESYTLPSRKVFDNHEITAADKENLMQARNLAALSSGGTQSVALQYGVLVSNTDLRSFPTGKRLTSEVQGRFDYLQETRLLVNEPVIVLHQSLDGAWCFVQAENYYGWIRESAIAYCREDELITVAEALADMEGKQIAVVTKNGVYRIGENQRYLRMGTRLLCTGASADTIAIKVPGRGTDGNLVWENASVSCLDADGETCFVQGYLPYTRANVMQLAIRLIGIPYAWGDALSFGADPAEQGDNGMDCSSTVSAVFRCFGFAMPRNTGTQRKMVCVKQDLTGFGTTQRKEVLDGLKGGELLYTSGHVMLYLGCVGEEYYILHNTSTEARDDGGKDEFYRCLITTTDLGKSGQTILERLIQMNALFSID